jgi:hypothetical protein
MVQIMLATAAAEIAENFVRGAPQLFAIDF